MKNPIKRSVVARHHTPIYTVHRYFARRPHNVFRNIIDNYLKNTSIILDPFSGGGVTLIEGLTAGHKVIGHEINSQACFIIDNQLSAVDTDLLSEALINCTDYCNDKLGAIYKFKRKDVYWYSWDSYTQCPKCNAKTVLNQETTIGNGVYECVQCKRSFRPKRISRNSIEPKSVCLYDGDISNGNLKTWIHKTTPPVLKRHHAKIKKALTISNYYLHDAQKTRIPKCNLEKESSLHAKDFLYFEDFITEKNQCWIMCFSEAINLHAQNKHIEKALYYIFSASLRYISRFSSLNSAWRKNNRPLEWAKSNFWTPYSFVELNPQVAIFQRFNAYLKATNDFHGRFNVAPKIGSAASVLKGKSDFSIVNKPSQKMNSIPDKCIDLILTDPPYGSYLNYGELSGFWMCWLKRVCSDYTNKKIISAHEAVTSRKKHKENYKTFNDYEQELEKVFQECYRVLKPESYMVLTFNNKEPEAWIALFRSIKKAGFILPDGGLIFQDGVDTYKRTIALRREGAIHGDFIYSFYKPKNSFKSKTMNTKEFDWIETSRIILKKAYEKVDVLSNSDLYLEINQHLLPKLYKHLATDGKFQENLSSFNLKNLEVLLNKTLYFKKGYWSIKG